jgi:hypothetical protein
MTADADDASSALFWDLVTELQGIDGRVHEGTIMGGSCARVSGEFLAMPNFRGPGLVVKLPAARVNELIEVGTGASFAPAGKVFREWVLIEALDEAAWRKLLLEGVAFVAP